MANPHPDTLTQTTCDLSLLGEDDQSIKQDDGKLDMGAVYRHFPRALEAVAKVREGSRLLKGRHNYTWEDVEIDRWRKSYERHFTKWNKATRNAQLEYWEHLIMDEEFTHIPHHHLMLCSLLAIIELEERAKES